MATRAARRCQGDGCDRPALSVIAPHKRKLHRSGRRAYMKDHDLCERCWEKAVEESKQRVERGDF